MTSSSYTPFIVGEPMCTLTAFLEWIEWCGLNVDASLAAGYGGNTDVKLHFRSLRPQISHPILAELAEFRNLIRVSKFGRRVCAS